MYCNDIHRARDSAYKLSLLDYVNGLQDVSRHQTTGKERVLALRRIMPFSEYVDECVASYPAAEQNCQCLKLWKP